LWAWIGVVYHLAFFAAINPAAPAFGALFLASALGFVWFGVIRGQSTFEVRRDGATVLGLLLLIYALLIYPIWSSASGHAYPHLPTFGLPCPTTIFTVGMLTLCRGPCRRILFIGPILWAFVGTQAAFLFDVLPDLGLGVAGLVAAVLAVRRRTPSTRVATVTPRVR
jgi:hypothetical protein